MKYTQKEMNERKRMNYKRRIRKLLVDRGLPPMGDLYMDRMIDATDKVRGDGLTDPDLLVLCALTLRGLFD